MDKEYKILAIDETGKASYNHPSKNFVLSGIIVPEKSKQKLNKSMCKLKKKFFDDEKIIFHCRDILRKKGPFACLRDDEEKEIQFWTHFTNILNRDEISLAFVITDKSKAIKLNWNDIAILRRAYKKLLEEFTANHLENYNGKIVVESEPYQDKYLIEAHNKLQGQGIPLKNVTASSYRKKITSLSLVNKLNLDDHVQIADSLAVMADMVYKIKMGEFKNLTKVQSMMKRLIDRKMANGLGIFEVLV